MITGILTGFCEASNPKRCAVAIGGTYHSPTGNLVSGYGIYVDEKLTEVIPGKKPEAIEEAYVAVSRHSFQMADCRKVTGARNYGSVLQVSDFAAETFKPLS